MIRMPQDAMSQVKVGNVIFIDGEQLTVLSFWRQRGDHRYALCRRLNGKTKYIAVGKLTGKIGITAGTKPSTLKLITVPPAGAIVARRWEPGPPGTNAWDS